MEKFFLLVSRQNSGIRIRDITVKIPLYVIDFILRKNCIKLRPNQIPDVFS